MTVIVSLLLALATATAIWLAATVVLAAFMKVPVRTIVFGLGPVLTTFALDRGRSFELRAVPVSSNLVFRTRAEAAPGERVFASLDPGRKIALALAGCLACFAVAVLVLGFDEGLRAILATWGEVLRPVTQFNDTAAQWQPMVDIARAHNPVTLAALACAKVGAFNLLPLAGLSGFVALCLLFGWPLDNLPPAVDSYAKISLVVLLALLALWAFSGIEFVARTLGWLT